MQYLDLLHRTPTELKSKLRELEGLYQKIIRNKWAIAFNEVCINEQIMPKFTNYIFVEFFWRSVFMKNFLVEI